MLYRVRRYAAVPEQLAAFHDFFNGYLLPVQVRHGARLVGRWETDDAEVIAVWEYDDKAAYDRIDAAVRADPDSAKAREHRNTLGQLFTEKHETFARSTVESAGGPWRSGRLPP
jgi:hypothetical protein